MLECLDTATEALDDAHHNMLEHESRESTVVLCRIDLHEWRALYCFKGVALLASIVQCQMGLHCWPAM